MATISVDALYLPRETNIHGLAAETKLVGLVLGMVVVVLTSNLVALATYLLVAIGLALVVARLSPVLLMRRMTVELPFVAFAILMPIAGPEPNVSVLGLSMSEAGLTAGLTFLAKATTGVILAIILAATTPVPELLAGLRNLRLPWQLVQILTAMARYIDLVVQETQRMRQARAARGFAVKGWRSWPVLAQSIGALFLRTFERGERVHLAMMARGYTGQATPDGPTGMSASGLAPALILPAVFAAIALLVQTLVS